MSLFPLLLLLLFLILFFRFNIYVKSCDICLSLSKPLHSAQYYLGPSKQYLFFITLLLVCVCLLIWNESPVGSICRGLVFLSIQSLYLLVRALIIFHLRYFLIEMYLLPFLIYVYDTCLFFLKKSLQHFL